MLAVNEIALFAVGFAQFGFSISFDIVKKISYPEIPPRVEYEFTEFGLRFIKILDTINELEEFCRTSQSN